MAETTTTTTPRKRKRVEIAPRFMPILDGCRHYGLSRTRAYKMQAAGVPLLRRLGGRTLLDCAVAERVMGDLPLVRTGKRRPE